MLNFRKLKQDISPSVLKDGRGLFEKKQVESAKIVTLAPQSVRIHCRVQGSFENTYACTVEIDRRESMITDSDCDCPYKYDCQHLAAVIFHLENHFDEILITFSKESDMEAADPGNEGEIETLRETIREAETKEVVRRDKKNQKELLEEYANAANVLGKSPFFLSPETFFQDKAELIVIFCNPSSLTDNHMEVQLALRLPLRSKPLNIPNSKEFIDAVKYQEPFYIGNKRYFFTFSSFDAHSAGTLEIIINSARFPEAREERFLRILHLELEAFGSILARAHEKGGAQIVKSTSEGEATVQIIPWFYQGTFDEPLCLSTCPASLNIELEYLEAPAPKILLKPALLLDNVNKIKPEEVRLFECAKPGMIYQNTYYRFQPQICRKHLRNLATIRDITIPEPLFGTFVENSLPQLMRYAEVSNKSVIDRFVTLPYVGVLSAECDITYLNGELEVPLDFLYDDVKVPAVSSKLTVENISPFVTQQGILARNLTDEQQIIDDLFQDFIFDPQLGSFVCKIDKKIVEFMTEVIPRNQHRVTFKCPENLLEQFIYDNTHFKLHLKETSRIDVYQVELKVDGHLNGTTVDLLWDCLTTRRAFIELHRKKNVRKKAASEPGKAHKILVLDLERLAPVVQIFDEIGLMLLEDHIEERPLWSLASIDPELFIGLPIEFSMSERLKQIQQQMLGAADFACSPIPQQIRATPRSYQLEGSGWLERLRCMHLNGILADDMGLGKTLQAIIALTQNKLTNKNSISIVVCPTSLVYNWKEEINKFNPQLKALPVDGTPTQRKKLLNDIQQHDVVITSYSLLQKDIEFYREIPFSYIILDEAQHIKNRGTRNAKSVKMMQGAHRLILTGTPIENSLDELWSLFDFLMPGLLSSYERFVEKYIRNSTSAEVNPLGGLRKKIAPFILRRLKKDVLSELPPISELVYRCSLSPVQKALYQSYATSAREELSRLVKKEGFEKVQIHVLATLTRLKQICCHPAIFAKEKAEPGDSSKYDMLMELLQTLIEGKHKTVIFSQYTRMLNIIRQDLLQQGIPFEYLDGSSKNRLDIVNNFNDNPSIPVFLVSLKAGGTGLNLVGADTVIHYDMWWNPAVDSQATGRLWRLGQKNPVSSLRLITNDTIEEKIMEIQAYKKDLDKKLMSGEEDALSKLTWEEILELLQT